ncbi:MAG: glycosyltransferase [Vampirovibrionales bacterium]|nr:glycosyltransferase [Vampirovibrionales bacterium]
MTLRILLINNFFTAHGGAEAMLEGLYHGLQQAGHKVFAYACQPMEGNISHGKPLLDPDYIYANYFPQTPDLEKLSLPRQVLQMPHTIYNQHAAQNLEAFIRHVKPQIAHVHGINRYLTPSVMQACKNNALPVVMTAHDSFLACPASTLMRGNPGTGQTYCQDVLCSTDKALGALHAIQNRCLRGSLPKSAYAALEFSARKWHRLYQIPKLYSCPSQALKHVMVQAAFPKDHIHVIENFVDNLYFTPQATEETAQALLAFGLTPGYFLYTGRLVAEKGIAELLEAFKALPEQRLVLVGHGTMEPEVQAACQASSNIRLIPFQPKPVLKQLYAGCKALVSPVNWFEAFGLTLAEAGALGKPVIASRMGAIPEVITDAHTGLLIPPANAEALKAAILTLANNDALCETLGQQAAAKTRERYQLATYVQRHEALYSEAFAMLRTHAR